MTVSTIRRSENACASAQSLDRLPERFPDLLASPPRSERRGDSGKQPLGVGSGRLAAGFMHDSGFMNLRDFGMGGAT